MFLCKIANFQKYHTLTKIKNYIYPMEKITIDDKRIFTDITDVCRTVFGCEPERMNSWNREKQCYESEILPFFVPQILKTAYGGKYGKYEIGFANTSPDYWRGFLCATEEYFDRCNESINSCEECEYNIKDSANKKFGKKIREVSLYPCNFKPDDLKRPFIAFLNFGEWQNKQITFVGVFYFDENQNFIQGSHFYKKIANEFPNQDKNEFDLPKAAIKIIEDNLPNFLNEKQFTKPGITIEDAAKILGTNRDYLSKYINSVKNRNFTQWINELRIEYSKTLMRENTMISLGEVSDKSGFSHPSHFTKHFTVLTGVSPSIWSHNFL